MPSTPDLQATDRCVMCGLCQAHCPTYRVSRNEGDSPRGRIALMQAMAQDSECMTPSMRAHLDACLQCRACERMCPSGVPFGALMDSARQWYTARPAAPTRSPLRLGQLAMRHLLPYPTRMRHAARGLRLYQRSGLQALVRGTGLLRRLKLARADALLSRPVRPPRRQDYHPPVNPVSAAPPRQVALFSGCMGELADAATLQATLTLLNHLGFGVHVPVRQTCCGALHLHQGDVDTARRLAEDNLRAFGTLDVEAILSTATGCGAHLSEYDRLTDASGFVARVQDINLFLAAQLADQPLPLRPLDEPVAVHVPCSQRNVLRQETQSFRLLEHIPAIQLRPLASQRFCCGAAGSHMLSHPDMADTLRAPHLEAAAALGARILVSANIGCALHLAAGFREKGIEMEVMHPVSLLARQLM